MTDIQTAIRQYLEKHGFGSFAPKAVLFDMDGVLYDSMPRHAIAWHDVMEREGITMSKTDAYLYEGMRGVETISLLFRQQKGIEITPERAQHIYDLKSKAYGAQGKAPKMDGVEDLMRQMHDDGMKICVVTGSGQHNLLDHLEEDFPGLLPPTPISWDWRNAVCNLGRPSWWRTPRVAWRLAWLPKSSPWR